MGAPNKRRVHVLFAKRVDEALDDIAAEEGTTKSAVLREAALELLRRRRPDLFVPAKKADRNGG